MEVAATWADARSQLLPVLRQVVEPPQAWRVALATPKLALVRQQVLPMLHALVVLEHEEQRVFVSHELAEGWGVSPDEVLAVARDNLSSKATEGLQPRVEYGLWQLASGDGLASSRLLLPGWLAGFRDTVKGRPVAIVPAPRVLLVGGDEAAGQIERLVSLGRDGFRNAAQGLSPVPYTVDEANRVVPWQGDGELGAEAAASQRLLDVVCYAAQRDQLAGTVPSSVPQVTMVREGSGYRTRCTWSPHPDGTLLPRTDLVRLDKDGPLVPFAAIERLARGALEALPMQPERFQARWPSQGILQALAAEAVAEPSS